MSEPATQAGELDELVGTTLAERYRIDGLLGVGGMGAVFQARHLLLKRDVAVKVLHPQLSTNEELSRRFDREAQSAARLDHPNIIPVSEFGSTDEGMKYMVMPVLQGQELADLITEPLDPLRAIELEIQILRGLEHAHQNGVVHRDLKPENVFVTRDHDDEEILKLVDFGIAKILDEEHDEDSESSQPLTRMGLIFGTPQYMSPEQATGGQIDHRTDIYSAGVILYQMLAGAIPFDSEDPVAVTRMQVTLDPPPLPDSVPPELQEIVLGMMAKTRDERIPDARTARKALQVVLGRLADASGVVVKHTAYDTGVIDPRDIYPPGHEALTQNPAFAGDSGSGPRLGQPGTYNASEHSSDAGTSPTQPAVGSSASTPRPTMSLADALTSSHPALEAKRSPIAAFLAGLPKTYWYVAGGVFGLLFLIALWPSGKGEDEGEGEGEGDSAAVASSGDDEGVLQPVETKLSPEQLDEIDKVLSSNNAEEAVRLIQPELDKHPEDPQLIWRYGKAMSLKKAKSDRVIALEHYGEAYELDPTLFQDPDFYAELNALLDSLQLREQAIDLAVQKLGKDGHKFLLELVNNQKRSLGWFDRHRVLDVLAADLEANAQVDWKLNIRRDLEKAEHAPEPCAAFIEALDKIAESKDEYYVDIVFTVKPPPPSTEDEDKEDAALCELHEAKLTVVRELMAVAQPEASAKYQNTKSKKKKKRRGR